MTGWITDDSIERVVRASDLVDLVQGYTQLRRSGGEWQGRCPFHEERTPSFWVNNEKGVYYCFGCGQSGNTITFVQEKLGYDFREAVDFLADRARIELDFDESRAERAARSGRPRRKRLQELLQTAESFFRAVLERSDGAAHARAYLTGRGITADAIEAFGIGYAPNEPRAVVDRARAKGFTAEELTAAGLVTRKGSDLFRGRVVFPIRDRAGRPVAFGGRKLRDDDYGGKYVNSPEGPLFDKSATLFRAPGLREACKEHGSIIVCEGYLDVIGLWQAGLGNCCAVMGTALTQRNLRELVRDTTRIHVAFDPDSSGRAAVIRSFAKLGDELEGVDVRVVSLPEGQDPFDISSADGGRERFDALLAEAEPLLSFRVSSLLAAADLTEPAGRNEAWRWAQKLFASVPPSPERAEQIERICDRLDLQRSMAEQLHRTGLADSARPRSDQRGTQGPGRGGFDRRNRRPRGEATFAEPPRRRSPLSPTDQDERRFLAALLALCGAGGDPAAVAVAGVEATEIPEDPGAAPVTDYHFGSRLHARAFSAIISARGNPIDNIPVHSDSELIRLIAELTAQSERHGLSSDPAVTSRVLDELGTRVKAHYLDRVISRLKADLASADIDREQMAELARLGAQRDALREQLRSVTIEE